MRLIFITCVKIKKFENKFHTERPVYFLLLKEYLSFAHLTETVSMSRR